MKVFAGIFTGLLLLLALFLPAEVLSQQDEILTEFIGAVNKRDNLRMTAIVKENREKIPQVIKTILYKTYSPNVADDEKEYLFYAGEALARTYNEVSGDIEPLIEIKRAAFESKLSKPVRLEPADGVSVIDLPPANEDVKNIFKPDNVIIKKGETVRWVNSDTIAHVFASMSYIGKGGLYVPNLKPGEVFEKTFDEPGEYYYICYIHKGMIGKIKVEE